MPAEARKAEIVDCALALADSVGPDHLTTDMIARDVGVSQPAIFRHFPRKEAIWEAVAQRLRDDMTAAWDKARPAEGSARRRLEALAMAQIDAILTTPGLIGILFSRELHVRNDVLRAALAGNQRKFHALLSEAVRAGVASGEFRSDLDPADAAFLTISVIQSSALRWSLGEKKFDLAAEAARLLAALTAGFRSERS